MGLSPNFAVNIFRPCTHLKHFYRMMDLVFAPLILPQKNPLNFAVYFSDSSKILSRNPSDFSKSLINDDYTFFHRQLDFSSEPGVANKILENEPKSCLTVT